MRWRDLSPQQQQRETDAIITAGLRCAGAWMMPVTRHLCRDRDETFSLPKPEPEAAGSVPAGLPDRTVILFKSPPCLAFTLPRRA